MRVHILGGGNEVGASMLMVEAGEARVVMDCGVRMGAGSSLPDLSMVDSLEPQAIFVTHAHLDHIGALPLLHMARPRLPIYCTAATRMLARVLLLDAVKIMEERLSREGEVPLYPVEAVQAVLGAMQEVPYGARIDLAGQVSARMLPAGHILGASMVAVDGPDGNMLVTGDISSADQATVAGMAMPKERFDVLVMESTYGGRLHADRPSEEKRLIDKVREVIGRGGKLVVPAFALGRAQEILLILIRAFRKDMLPPVPVFADGMVRQICQVYSTFGRYLMPFPKRLTEKVGNPFFGVVDNVNPVKDFAHRERIMAGGPCVVISSSGMLTGGASVYYAEKVASDPLSCIAITGYQDEEAPGRALLELAERGEGSLKLNGQEVTVKAEVARYALSAHIDGYSAVQMAMGLGPRHVVLVHGDDDARAWMAKQITCGKAWTPDNGETLDLPCPRRRQTTSARGIGQGQPLETDQLPFLAHMLRVEGLEGKVVELRYMLERWYGRGGWSEEHEDDIATLMAGSEHFEMVMTAKRMAFRLLAPPDADAQAKEAEGPCKQHEVSQLVELHLPATTGLRRVSLYPEEHRASLSFAFPRRAKAEHQEALERLEEESGWTMEVYPLPMLEEVLAKAREILSPHCEVSKVGFAPEGEVVMAKVRGLDMALARALSDKILEETGYPMEIKPLESVAAPSAPPPVREVGSGDRMEINEAFSTIVRAFDSVDWKPIKRSRKVGPGGDYIELRFVTPYVAERVEGLLADLSSRTGYPLVVSPNVTPQELQRLAMVVLPQEAVVAGQPSIFGGQRKVLVKLRSPLSEEDHRTAVERFRELTGFELDLV